MNDEFTFQDTEIDKIKLQYGPYYMGHILWAR